MKGLSQNICYQPGIIKAQIDKINDLESKVKELEAENERLKEELLAWQDRFNNGLEENEDGSFTVVWTQRELDKAKKHADEFCEKLGIKD